MPKSLFAVPVLVVLCLACSGGRRKEPDPKPTPNGAASSLQGVLLQLGQKPCRLREIGTGKWVLEFEKRGVPRTFEVLSVGVDYVRLREAEIVLDLPFASIALVTSDD